MHTPETPFVSLADILRAQPAVTIAPVSPAQATPAPAGSVPVTPAPAAFVSVTPAVGFVPVTPAPAQFEPVTPGPAGGVPTLAPLGGLSEQAAALRDVRLFRAALGDAFDALVANLARELALQVLARELRLAAVDIEMLARRLIAERWAEEPLRLRVAPADAHVACELPLTVDPELQPGDAILECRSGSIDARLRVRLAGVLATAES